MWKDKEAVGSEKGGEDRSREGPACSVARQTFGVMGCPQTSLSSVSPWKGKRSETGVKLRFSEYLCVPASNSHNSETQGVTPCVSFK